MVNRGVYSTRSGERSVETKYAYRAVAEPKTGGCPRCGGFVGKDWEQDCVNCGWAGPTREGTNITLDPVMAGGRGGRLAQERDAMIREYHRAGISTSVIARMVGVSTRTVRRATQFQ